MFFIEYLIMWISGIDDGHLPIILKFEPRVVGVYSKRKYNLLRSEKLPRDARYNGSKLTLDCKNILFYTFLYLYKLYKRSILKNRYLSRHFDCICKARLGLSAEIS